MSYLMIVVGWFVDVATTLLTVYMWAAIASALLTWVNPDPYNPIVRFLRSITDPVYLRIRRWMPFVVVGSMDLSPLVVIFGIQLVVKLLNELYLNVGMSMRMLGA